MTGTESIVAIGTTRAPKLRAVRRVLFELNERFPRFLPGEIRLEPRGVPSGVPETPRTIEEAMAGARARAEAAWRALRDDGVEPLLAVGLEGGVVELAGAAFLESWAYVTDGGRGHFGSSGSIPLPHPLARAVLDRGEELGSAADEYFRRTEVAAHEGTFGVLTRMMVSREEAFARSLLHALAPFYNSTAYGS